MTMIQDAGADHASAAWPGHIDKFRAYARLARTLAYTILGASFLVVCVAGVMAFHAAQRGSGPAGGGAVAMLAFAGVLALLGFGVSFAVAWVLANALVSFADSSTGGLWALCSVSPVPGPPLERPLDETGARLKRLTFILGVVCYIIAALGALMALVFLLVGALPAVLQQVAGTLTYYFLGGLLIAGGQLVADGPRAVYAYRAGRPLDASGLVRLAARTVSGRRGAAVRCELGGGIAVLTTALLLAFPALLAAGGRLGDAGRVGLGIVAVAGVGVVLAVATGILFSSASRLAARGVLAGLNIPEGSWPAMGSTAAADAHAARSSSGVLAFFYYIQVWFLALFGLVGAAGLLFGGGVSQGVTIPTGGALSEEVTIMPTGVLVLGMIGALWLGVAVAGCWIAARLLKHGGAALAEGYLLLPTLHKPPEGRV